jgi:predicted DNA-binding transcriptional regulator AlpA
MPAKFVTTRAVAERYSRGPRTIARWIAEPAKSPDGFPRPFLMGRRWLWSEEELAVWERENACARRAA